MLDTLTLAEAARLDRGGRVRRRAAWRRRCARRRTSCDTPAAALLLPSLRAAAKRCAALQGRRSSRRTREHPRVSGEGDSSRAKACPIPPGEVATTPDAGRAIARTHRRHGGGEGAGARRRPRQGRRRQARQDAGRSARRSASRSSACRSRGSRSRRCSSPPAADIASEAYVGIIVDRASKTRRVHGEPRRRHRHRGGRRDDAREDPAASRSIRATGCSRIEAMRLGFFLYRRRRSRCARPRRSCSSSTARSSTAARSLAEINPLVTTPDGRGRRARRQDGDRRQRARSPPRHRGAARRERGGAERGRRRATRTSPSSSSTATSAAS